jgi:hypothetical protein
MPLVPLICSALVALRDAFVSTMSALIRRRGRAFADIATAREYLIDSAHCTGSVGATRGA